MNRSAASLLLAIVLAGYGIYRALFVPTMLVGPPVPLLLIGFLLQAVSVLGLIVAFLVAAYVKGQLGASRTTDDRLLDA
jgi:hypothetical protein